MSKARFTAELLRPASPGRGGAWGFVVLPKAVSKALPRRGRTSVEGTLNKQPFLLTLEPDGQQSHWLKVDRKLREAAGADFGDKVSLEIAPVAKEPEPEIPPDLRAALDAAPGALATWRSTTTLARVDWIHWITTAKQARTRAERVNNACDMLASGKKRVCCFDPSGYYSKAFCAPEPAG